MKVSGWANFGAGITNLRSVVFSSFSMLSYGPIANSSICRWKKVLLQKYCCKGPACKGTAVEMVRELKWPWPAYRIAAIRCKCTAVLQNHCCKMYCCLGSRRIELNSLERVILPPRRAVMMGQNMSLSAVLLFLLLLLRSLGCRTCCLFHQSRLFLRTTSATSSPFELKAR